MALLDRIATPEQLTQRELSQLIGRNQQGLTQVDFEFVEREATPQLLTRPSIQLHLAILSLSNTVLVLELFGVKRARSTVHTGCTKPTDSRFEMESRTRRCRRNWNPTRRRAVLLYAAVGPETNGLSRAALDRTRTTVTGRSFLANSREEHGVMSCGSR